MISLLAVVQLAVAIPTHLSPRDSANLVARVREAEFQYIMDWRHEWETWRTYLDIVTKSLEKEVSRMAAPPDVRSPAGECVIPRPGMNAQPQTIRIDLDQHEAMAHYIAAPVHFQFSRCPMWVSPVDTEPADEALGIDNPLPPEFRDTVRARRVPLLALLDTAAGALPGDPWLAGQRVRMHIDQQEGAQALQAARECRAAAWWCAMLRGYVQYTTHDAVGALAAFDSGRARMPTDTACRWNDLSMLLNYSARMAYQKLGCAEQAEVNARMWWLADPLYLLPGNDREAEHFARRVLAELHAGNDADEREDMRTPYTGPVMWEMIIRYGWPTTMVWSPVGEHVPPGWGRFDTHATYLGVTHMNEPLPARPMYWGPQFHTIPSWKALTDPLHAATTDWDLGPERYSSLLWDSSWWAPEFYDRVEGPLVDLTTQIGFIRRHASAAIVAATEWGIDPTILAPPTHAAVGVITSGGPTEKPRIVGVKMNGAHPRAIVTPVESRPLLLGVEMVPQNDSGPAGRTRFGIAPPPPLSALHHGDLALSDLMLVRAAPGQSYPPSIQDVLPRMYGSTTLVDPIRLAIFWEVYGQGDGDTVDVSLRIVRRNDAGGLARAAAAVGIGHAGDDSVSVRWREPRPGDPLAFADSGVSVRPRGFALDVSALTAGSYTLSVQINRRDVSATSAPRDFTIVRR